jgi:5-deoxy-glucuronate isomerase
MLETLAVRGRETNLIDLWLIRVATGECETMRHEGEMCAVVQSGAVEARIGGTGVGTAVRHGNVFEAMADAVYVPPGQMLELVALSPAIVAVAAAPLGEGEPGRARVIRPHDQHVRVAGTGNWSRTIRTVLGPDDEAGRLVLGETISPPGNWSSYPPHKHDRQAPPEEVALEEVYYYRVQPEGGFGVQVIYDDGSEHARLVRDGDVVAIPSGYHPVVAAPGYALYYLWVMAGQGRELAPFFDPRHAWVQEEA